MSYNGEKNGNTYLNGYVHPVKTVYDEKTMTYRTITERKVLQVLDKKEDVEFYRRAARTDTTIKVVELDETDLLYLNLKDEPNLSDEEIAALFQRKEELPEQETEAVVNFGTSDLEKVVPNFGTKDTWVLSGTALDCLKKYAPALTEEEIEEILLGMEAGLDDKQIKSYFCLPVAQMCQYRRIYQIENQK